MGIKIKNLQTGEFEKFNIPALKGEKGEPGEIEPSEKVDYIGKQHSKLRDTMNTNVDYIIKTAIGEFNYLDYEGQHITTTNSIEGHAKSAILSGKTLVNYFPEYTKTMAIGTGSWRIIFNGKINIPLTPNTSYLFINNSNVGKKINVSVIDETTAERNVIANLTTNIAKFTTPDTTDNFPRMNVYLMEDNTSELTYDSFMVIPYQDGMENWDIPYFEGMQSVKMPGLTTIGKNLFNGVLFDGRPTDITPNMNYKNTGFIEVKSNESYAIQSDGKMDGVYFFNENKEIISTASTPYTTTKVITPEKCKYISVQIFQRNEPKIQIEKGTQATTYEPYKTNILTVNEEVELRGIGEVKDTLDCLTGEYVKHIEEVVFDGSDDENWELLNSPLDNNISFKIVLSVPTSSYANCISDKLNDIGGSMAAKTENGICISNSGKYFCLKISIELANSIDSLKSYLSQNPLIVQYQLATESVKTVDLSDNHVYSYKGTTHYDCSSAEGSLVPTLSVKVPTDTQLTIQEQKATTQTLLIKNMDLQQSIKEVQAMNLAFNTALYNSFNSIREEVEDIKKHISTNENLEGSF